MDQSAREHAVGGLESVQTRQRAPRGQLEYRAAAIGRVAGFVSAVRGCPVKVAIEPFNECSLRSITVLASHLWAEVINGRQHSG